MIIRRLCSADNIKINDFHSSAARAGCSGSDRSLEQSSLVDVATLFENGNNLLDAQSLREHFIVLLEQVVHPALSLGRQGTALSCNHVPVEVEDSEL